MGGVGDRWGEMICGVEGIGGLGASGWDREGETGRVGGRWGEGTGGEGWIGGRVRWGELGRMGDW